MTPKSLIPKELDDKDEEEPSNVFLLLFIAS